MCPDPVIEAIPESVPVRASPRRDKKSRAITTATGAIASAGAAALAAEATEVKDPAREALLVSLEQELLTLVSQTGLILVRVKRTPAASVSGDGAAAENAVPRPRRRLAINPSTAASASENGTSDLPVNSPFGAVTMGREAAQKIEGRARGLLLETSLTQIQQDRIERILQSAQDLLCALQASRYAWQMALLLPQEGQSGRTALPRLKRVTECAIEMSSRVALAIEGRDGAAAAVAEQYRAFLLVKEETSVHFSGWRENGILSQTARRMVRAALWSTTVAAESLAKVAARFALPLETAREVNKDHDKYKHLDRGDDLLAPLRRR